MGDSPDPFRLGENFIWRSGERVRNLKLSGKRSHGNRILLRFDGITDPQAAQDLAGGILCLPLARMPSGPPGFYWSHEVEGWNCEDRAGRTLGVVRVLQETPAGPQLSLEAPDGREILVPFVTPIVAEIDAGSRRIVLDPPEGLMDLRGPFGW